MNAGREDARLLGYSRAVAWVAVGITTIVMIGWITGNAALTGRELTGTTMKFNTAICLLAVALTLLIESTAVRRVLLLLAAIIAILTLGEAWTDGGTGIDGLFLNDTLTPDTSTPGRMSPATAVAILGLAVGRACSIRGYRLWAETLLGVPFVITAVAVLGHLYRVDPLFEIARITQIPSHTAVLTFALATAISALVPDGVLPWVVRGSGPGATLLRRAIPIIVIGLIVFGYIRMVLGDAGVISEHFGIAILVIAALTIAVNTLLLTGRRLDRADEQRLAAERLLRRLNATLQRGRDQEWRRAETLRRELAAERERFDRAVASTGSVVWSVEQTAAGPVPVYVTSNAPDVLGTTIAEDETLFDALTRVVDAPDREALARYRDLAKSDQDEEVELQLAIRETTRWLTIRAVRRAEGDRVFYDGILTDTTAAHLVAAQRERLLAEERRHVERLSTLNQVRDEFIALAGHELRTPVTVIVGYLEILAEPTINDEERRHAIEAVTRRANQLNHLIERVFDLAKIDAGSLDLALQPLEVGRFLRDLVTGHEPGAHRAGITITLDVGAAWVLADTTRLSQIFDNLLTNTFKYVPAGGTTTIRMAAEGPTVTILMADDGPGVDSEELPHLFDRLYRSSHARMSGIPGTGLGLAVTKALVEAHGGTLAVAANDPHGLVFELRLPRIEASGRELV